MKKLICTALFVVISGCNTTPENLMVDQTKPLVNFASAQQNQASQGEQARWGGIIASVANLEHSTRLEVVNFELKSSLRPKQSDQTLGRFYVYVDGLLDPMIFQKGKAVTVVGEIAAQELGKIGEHPYQYPVLKAKGVHLWKQEAQRVDIQWMNDPYWNHPAYWGFYPYSRHQQVIIRSNDNSKPSRAVPPKNTNQIGR